MERFRRSSGLRARGEKSVDKQLGIKQPTPLRPVTSSFWITCLETESEGVREQVRRRSPVPSLTGGSQSVADFTGQRANEKLVGCEARGQKLLLSPTTRFHAIGIPPEPSSNYAHFGRSPDKYAHPFDPTIPEKINFHFVPNIFANFDVFTQIQMYRF